MVLCSTDGEKSSRRAQSRRSYMGRIHQALTRATGGDPADLEETSFSLDEYPSEHRPRLDGENRQRLDGENRLLSSPVPDVGPISVPSAVSDAGPIAVASAVRDARPISAATLGLELSVERMRHCQRIATTLQAAQVPNGLKTVAIASAAAGEGKTTTMLGLAMMLTRKNSSRVLLVDANFCRPALHNAIGIEHGPGVIDFVSGERPKAEPLVLHPSLHVLLAGRASMYPAADLGSERLRGLLKQYAADYDWVLVDTPALSQLGDEADVLGRLTDGVVFVIGPMTPFAVAERAMAAIGEGQILATLLDGLSDPVPYP
jgi:Mrp family chromosome partitioning ATPase